MFLSVLVKGKERQRRMTAISKYVGLRRLSLLFISVGAKFIGLAKLKMTEVVVFSISRGLRLATFPTSLLINFGTACTVHPRWHLLLNLAVQTSRRFRYLLVFHKIRNPEYCRTGVLGLSVS